MSKNLFSATAVFAVAAFFAASLPGCDVSPPQQPAAGKPRIGVLAYKRDDTYVSLVTGAIRETLADAAEMEVVYAENDQLLQDEQIAAMLKKNCAALAVNIVDHLAAATAVDAIKRAGIPVVFFNREPDLNGLKTYDKARFVGTDAFDAGILQGDIIRELWTKHPEYDKNKDGVCQYLMIQADLNNPEALARTEYSVRQARAGGVGMRQVGETLFCGWEEKLARETLRLLFPQHENSIELIIANNDAMALGAIQALNEFGYNLEGGDPAKFIPVVGVDAVPRAMEAIRKGTMSGTVLQDGKAMGKTVATMLINAVGGRNFLEGVPYPWDESGIAVRIPYARHDGGR